MIDIEKLKELSEKIKECDLKCEVDVTRGEYEGLLKRVELLEKHD